MEKNNFIEFESVKSDDIISFLEKNSDIQKVTIKNVFVTNRLICVLKLFGKTAILKNCSIPEDSNSNLSSNIILSGFDYYKEF